MQRKWRVNLWIDKFLKELDVSILYSKNQNEMHFPLILGIIGYSTTFDNSSTSLHDVWITSGEYTTLHHREIRNRSLE